MAKSGGGGTVTLLRLSGLIFGFVGTMHVLRYVNQWEFRFGSFELTLLGSLILGLCLVALSAACFAHSRR